MSTIGAEDAFGLTGDPVVLTEGRPELLWHTKAKFGRQRRKLHFYFLFNQTSASNKTDEEFKYSILLELNLKHMKTYLSW